MRPDWRSAVVLPVAGGPTITYQGISRRNLRPPSLRRFSSSITSWNLRADRRDALRRRDRAASPPGAAISATNIRLARIARRCAMISQTSQRMTRPAMIRDAHRVGDAKGSAAPTLTIGPKIQTISESSARPMSAKASATSGSPRGSAGCPSQSLFSTSISTRRFSARPSRVLSSAIGSVAARPSERTRSAGTPFCTSRSAIVCGAGLAKGSGCCGSGLLLQTDAVGMADDGDVADQVLVRRR